MAGLYFFVPSFAYALKQMFRQLYFHDEKGLRMVIVTARDSAWLKALGLAALQTIAFPRAQPLLLNALLGVLNVGAALVLFTAGTLLGTAFWHLVGNVFSPLALRLGKRLGEGVGPRLRRFAPWLIVLFAATGWVPPAILGFATGFTRYALLRTAALLAAGLLIGLGIHLLAGSFGA